MLNKTALSITLISFIVIYSLGVILDVSYLFVFSIMATVLVLLICKWPKLTLPLLTGFILRLVMVFLIHNEIIYEGNWDGYMGRAIQWSEDGFIATFDHFVLGAYFYSWLSSLLFSIFGVHLTLVRMINAFLSALIIANVFLICSKLWDKSTAKVAAWIMALFPTAIIYSSYFCNREPLNTFLFTLSILFFLRWLDSMRFHDFLIMLFLYTIAIILHTGFIVGLVLLFPVIFIKIFRSNKDYAIKYLYLIFLIAMIFLSLQILRSGMLDKINLGGDTILDKLSWYTRSSSSGRAQYLNNLSLDNYFDALWQAPIRTAYFLLMPFPWMMGTIRDIYGNIDALFYFIILFIFLVHGKPLLKSPKARLLFALTLLITIAFAFATGNYGTALRHRAKFFPLYLCLVSPGIIHMWNKLRYIYRHSG